MVSKKSEYRQEYKPCLLKRNFSTYLENVHYRNHRRDLEFAHTPLSWEAEDLTPVSTSCEDIASDKIPLSKQRVDEEKEEENEEKKDDGKEVKKEKDIKDAQKEEEDSMVIIKQNGDLAKAAKEKLNKYASKENKNESEPEKSVKGKKESGSKITLQQPKKVDDKTFAYKLRPKRPDRLRKLPKARPFSAAMEKSKRKSPPQRPASASPEQPPFAMYGVSETGRDVGMQRTFNVRASKEVVNPAAFLALKKPLIEVKRREEMQRKALAREKKMKAPLFDKISREASSWETEYQNRFPAYEKSEYAKVLSARIPKDRPISVPYFF
ncbi:hypothetical protein CHS0354_007670 [Potamilus streckersoni]|uniref:Uncharacterized protein n=1 Tax=Potamilus streckersoni TaxID=2493646 RepID=A0AAE0SGX4_9BIVA|nr:hypothetical protein CHS0354_007670 [Potamilus streckersoni]